MLNIGYGPDLLAYLKADHRKRAQTFTAIGQASDAGDIATTIGHLEKFRSAIQANLLTKNVRPYIYLKACIDAGGH